MARSSRLMSIRLDSWSRFRISLTARSSPSCSSSSQTTPKPPSPSSRTRLHRFISLIGFRRLRAGSGTARVCSIQSARKHVSSLKNSTRSEEDSIEVTIHHDTEALSCKLPRAHPSIYSEESWRRSAVWMRHQARHG